MAKRYQVIIVGGGPVGAALAVDLGLRGVSCAAGRAAHRHAPHPQGPEPHPRTLEHFYRWGIGDALRAERIMPPGFPISGITAYGNLMSEYWYAPPQREIVRPYYFQDVERLPQYLTEKVLRAKMATLPSVEAGSAGRRIRRAGRRAACASRSPSPAARARRSRRTMSSAATARAPSCASRSASRAAAPISISSWCWPFFARASCMRG